MNHQQLLSDGWELAGHIGVDSGQAMVCDPCYVLREEGVAPEFAYEQCGEVTIPSPRFGSIPFSMGHDGAAVVTSSGFGDGFYPVYVKRKDFGDWGVRIVAMMVDFDSDDPAESLEEE
jgi:hypothetical protein